MAVDEALVDALVAAAQQHRARRRRRTPRTSAWSMRRPVGVKCTSGAGSPRPRSARTACERALQRLGQHHHARARRRRAGRRRGGSCRRRSRAAARACTSTWPVSNARRVTPCVRCGANSSGNSVMTSKRMADAGSVVQAPVDRDARARPGHVVDVGGDERDQPLVGFCRARRLPARSAARCAARCRAGRPPCRARSPSRLTTSGRSGRPSRTRRRPASGKLTRETNTRAPRSASAALRSATSCASATTTSPCSLGLGDLQQRAAAPRRATAALGDAGSSGGFRNQRRDENSACGSAAKGWTLIQPLTPQASTMRPTSTASSGQGSVGRAAGRARPALTARRRCSAQAAALACATRRATVGDSCAPWPAQ